MAMSTCFSVCIAISSVVCWQQYDDKAWLERLQDIVEVNGRQISELLCPSSFKEGDAVKVRQLVKGGRVKFWNGVDV